MLKSRKHSPWAYYGFPNDKAADDFGPLAPFAEIWRRKCPAPGVFPAWEDFDLMDFEGWWGRISLAEISNAPFDLRWALWGTVITTWWGVDYTNKFMSQIPSVKDVWENQERDYFQRLVDERLIGFVTGSLSAQNRKFYFVCGIDLPLAKNGVITHFLSAYKLCEPADRFLPAGKPVFKL